MMGKRMKRLMTVLLIFFAIIGVVTVLSNYGVVLFAAEYILWWAIILLFLFGLGGRWIYIGGRETAATVSSDEWITTHNWEDAPQLSYGRWDVYTNNRTQEVAIFNGQKSPDKLVDFKSIRGAEIQQKDEKKGRQIRFVIQFENGSPYIMPVTDGPIPANSQEYKLALAFAEQLNELIRLVHQANTSTDAVRKVIAKCPHCGQLIRGNAGQKGWCSRCDGEMRLPNT